MHPTGQHDACMQAKLNLSLLLKTTKGIQVVQADSEYANNLINEEVSNMRPSSCILTIVLMCQAGVVGMSCRSDVTEMLEKRVKSRFSYRRHLVLDTCCVSIQEENEGNLSLLSEMLTLPLGVSGLEENFIAHFNKSVRDALENESLQAALQRLCFKGGRT